ncbi:MAG: hypothetical protein ACSHWU_01415 [Marinicella sp.]
MSDDREKLKALLLSEEIAQIKALHDLLNDKTKLSQKVSEVLDPATDLAIAKNPRFKKKFSRIDPRSYVKAIRANKQTFIDALLPIIGPMIRQSVSSAIRKFVADINRTVEMGFSAKALKWRWKALRTGVPFAEIVFNNTIEYQVTQVFLIDSHSGLLIEHAGHEETLLQDKEAMSAMLTVIQDFVKDAVSKDGESLSAAELGDDLVWIINGNKANVAAVIKGAPTHRLRDQISSFLEDIHIDFHQQLEDQNFWNNSPELKSELETLLLTKSQSEDEDEKPQGTKFWPLLLVISLPLIWWAWTAYQNHKQTLELTLKLQQTSGFVLTGLRQESGQYIATGLQDPLTQFQNLGDHVIIDSTPFISLDDDIVSKRISQVLNNPELEVSTENNHITIKGQVENINEFKQKLDLIKVVNGTHQIADLTTQKTTLSLEKFLTENPPPHTVQVEESPDGLKLIGITTAAELNNYEDLLSKFGAIDASEVILYSETNLQSFIRTNQLILSDVIALNNEQKAHLDQIITAFKQLSVINNEVSIKLIARSDCQGSISESNQLNQQRLQLVQSYLLDQGLPKNKQVTENIRCATISNEVNRSNIGVWFEVMQ